MTRRTLILTALIGCALAAPASACRIERTMLSPDRPAAQPGELVPLLQVESALVRKTGSVEVIAYRMKVLKGAAQLPKGRRIIVPAPVWGDGCVYSAGVPDRNGRVTGFARVRRIAGTSGIYEIGRALPANVKRLEQHGVAPRSFVWRPVRFVDESQPGEAKR